MQLLWRLQHGELPATTDIKQAVILIGTNDLKAYHEQQVSPVRYHELTAGLLGIREFDDADSLLCLASQLALDLA